MRHMTDTFTPGLAPQSASYNSNIPEESTFKTQGNIIYTSFKEGTVEVAYKSIPVDENGFPLIIDNEIFIEALEAYIKKRVFTNKFDVGEISGNILTEAKQNYAMLAGQLRDEFMTPSISEMESITRYWTSLIPYVRHFDNGFKDLGNREYLKRH